MPLHSGAQYELDGVRIGPPDVEAIRRAPKDADVVSSVERWLSEAQRRGDVHYFSVYIPQSPSLRQRDTSRNRGGSTVTIAIRRATAEDVPAVVALEQELVRGDAPGDPYLVRTMRRQEVEEQYRTLIASNWAVCLVATHEGHVVGYLSGGLKDSPKWRPVRATEIHALYLKEAQRGSGIGAALIDAFIRWSEERGAEVVEVAAFASNNRAIAFYERAGFRSTLVHLEKRVRPGAARRDRTPDACP